MGKFYDAVRDKSTDVTIAGGDTGVSLFNVLKNTSGGFEELSARGHSIARNMRQKGDASDALAFQTELAISVVSRGKEVAQAFNDVRKSLKEDEGLEETFNQLFGSFEDVMEKAKSFK